NSDKDDSLQDLLPTGYMKLQYQLDAVASAKKMLDSYGGVFVADVVGLGKTYICAMLAKTLKKGRNKLIICPPVLVDYWDGVMKEFDVVADVISLGKLERLVDDPVKLAKYDYVFIDEAHRFRNDVTAGYTYLHQICSGKKVVLVSATPINNYSKDIANQIYLFQDRHGSTIVPNIRDLERFFAQLETKLSKFEKGTEEYKQAIKKNSAEIRDKLLRHIMVRRTRKEIIEYYSDDLNNQGLKFPKLGSPKPIEYIFDDNTDEVFTYTMKQITNLTYARYAPLLYLLDNKEVSQSLTGQKNLSGFMKSVLVKRLESSFHAFKMTLGRFIDSHEKFIAMAEDGQIFISKKVNVYEMLDNGEDAKLFELVEEDKAKHYKTAEFKREFLIDVKKDLAILLDLKEKWDTVKGDPKIEQFREELLKNKILKGNKVIVFTESKETAEYIGDYLKDDFGKRLVVFSGESSDARKLDIEYSFNPHYENDGKDKYDILITTDVLAEGINLHRAGILVNYDLPWNPTKIMQRGGRINRVGSKFDEIYLFNFFPTAQSDIHLPLKERIMDKLNLFHNTLGEDFKYLSEEEEVSSHNLYERLTASADGEEEELNKELFYLQLIRKIRDNDIELYNKIKNLPLKAKTGRESKKVAEVGTLTFIRKAALKKFFITEKESRELEFLEAIEYLECEKDEKKVPIEKKYFDDLEKNKDFFDDCLNAENIVIDPRGKSTGNEAKIIKTIKGIAASRMLTNEEEEYILKVKEAYEAGKIPKWISKNINKDLKEATEPIAAYHAIANQIPELYIKEDEGKAKAAKAEKQVILSMYLKNA
ncbi:MAG: helicase-related protein, partial [Anaerovoracaceae bacterium]